MPQCAGHYIMIFFILQLKYLPIYDTLCNMLIPIKKILDFHQLRTQSHIDCVNYFAGLIGYHFPEHDYDKMLGTIRTGYAHAVYKKYHPEFTLTETQRELYEMVHDDHHNSQPHHLEHYQNDVSKISDMTLMEMICDWHSASFEQRFITHEDSIGHTVYDYWSTRLHHLNWSEHQITTITEILEFLDMYTNHNDVMKIWSPLINLT